jgi:dTDP-4-dehydrorhamnose reductase
MRVAVTGAGGRLGRALIAALQDAPFTGPLGPLAWSRPTYDIDDPEAAARCIRQTAPEVVVHAAAWTDVDGCAREPERAMRRNALAVAELAEACLRTGADLVLVSTNEVFDGRRTDGRGYAPDDRPRPGNSYGASKLAGETSAQAAFLRHGGLIDAPGATRTGAAGPAAAGLAAVGPAGPAVIPAAGAPSSTIPAAPQLAIVRTAWLYGPPGNDFPARILAVADRAHATGESLRVVGDEVGSPTFAPDLAEGILDLLAAGTFAGVHHIVNAGSVSRAGWARHILAAAGVEVPIVEVPLATWTRPSTPPAWAVLAPTLLPSGEHLRSWQAAFADYAPVLVRERSAAARRGGSLVNRP